MYREPYEIELACNVRKLLFSAFCLTVAGIYAFFAIQILRAHWAASSLTPAGLQKAISLEPDNASHWSLLGRYKFFVEQDVPGSVLLYETATRLDPLAARSWLDLAAAYAVTGRSDDQARALRAAIAASPKSPQVAWEAGNFYLIRGEIAPALQNLRVVVEGDPTMRPQALRLAWRTFQDAPLLIEKILPPDPAAYWDLLRVTLEFHDPEAAKTAWNRIVQLNQPFPAKQAFPWVEFLLKSGESQLAQEVWHNLAKFDSSFFNYVPRAGSLIVNGGFEEDMLNLGFDWRSGRFREVEVHADTEKFHFGTRSVRMDFQGSFPRAAGPHQVVAVRPESEYTLSAFLKAEHLQTAVGASLVARDASTGEVIARSAPIDGTTGWSKRSITFRTGPNTSILDVGIGRAYETNTLMKGLLWLDDVELESR